ncbi:MAG: iron-containing alcohol dehydrogenase [Defluviitaleaceae bacterium]|nr:iron-containing alcohol dehydrogenase [Defluviitaleaceae bacterium]
MNNFTLHTPTDFVFGKDAEMNVSDMLKKHGATKVLIHYGGGSVIKSGLLQRVEDSMTTAGIAYIILGGAQPNPIDTLVYEGIDLCKKEGVDFVLAVGGGSAIDSAKAIAVGALYDGDFWDFFDRKRPIENALKVATILTIPAAGSEASNSMVITRTKDGGALKRGASSPHIIPVFSLLNPELNFTLPAFQTACGVADMMAHVMERYFTPTKDVEITDRLCEAVLLAIINEAPKAVKEPYNYGARANLTWAGTIAHNDSCGVGRVGDWASHQLEHELSALYGVAHGAGLAVMFPAWMKFVHETDLDRFVQFATRVWGVENTGDKKAVALKGIEAMENFFTSIGLPVNFEQLGAKAEDIETLVNTLHINMGDTIGGFRKLSMDDARKIYELAV